MSVKRIEIIGVPVDVCPIEELEGEILELLAKPGTKQIIFLSVWDLLKGRRRTDFAECLKNADLILPVSKSILNAAKFLKLPMPVRYNQFHAMINFISILENHFKSLYLLGGYKKQLQVAEKNVRSTFPNLQIVGRYVGNYPEKVESDVVQAIYKASPSLVLVSNGIKEKNLWSFHRRNLFSSSIFLYYKDSIGILSERVKRVNDSIFDKGLEVFSEVLHNPLKIFLIFPFIHFLLLVLVSKIKNKSRKTDTVRDNSENKENQE